MLPEEEAYLALFHGARRVAADCDGEAPRRERTPLDSQLEPTVLKRWLRRWTSVRHREAAERTRQLCWRLVAGQMVAARGAGRPYFFIIRCRARRGVFYGGQDFEENFRE